MNVYKDTKSHAKTKDKTVLVTGLGERCCAEAILICYLCLQ